MTGDTVREASTDEAVDLKKENTDLKQAVAELYQRNDGLKQRLTGQDVILGKDSELSVRRTLVELKVSRSSFYRWYRAYERDGLAHY